jgi:hypothetical protein
MGPVAEFGLFNWAYDNLEDKVGRTAAYTRLKVLAGLRDAEYDSTYWQQGIDRFLVRRVGGIVRILESRWL